MRRLIIVVTLSLVVVACAARKAPPAPQPGPVRPTPAPPSAAMMVDHEGDSTDTAAHVPADAPNEGIDFENNWIYDRFGRFRRRSWAIAHAGEGNGQRMYKMVKIELTDHSERTVYFDITENWRAWQPAAK